MISHGYLSRLELREDSRVVREIDSRPPHFSGIICQNCRPPPQLGLRFILGDVSRHIQKELGVFKFDPIMHSLFDEDFLNALTKLI